MEEVDFKISGVRYRLRRSEVISELKKREPGSIQTHAVNIDGTLFPVKEAFAQVTGLDLLDFNTNQARAQFKRLGFELRRVS